MTEKTELALYFELTDMATDENGNPCPAGMKIGFGEIDKDKLPPYDQLTKDLDLNALAAMFPNFSIVTERLKDGRAKLITPETYEELYGSDDEEEEASND